MFFEFQGMEVGFLNIIRVYLFGQVMSFFCVEFEIGLRDQNLFG